MAVNPSSTTVYTVTGTSLGCTATDQVTVTVNPNPTIDAGPDVSICAGEATTLTASGGQLYLWNPGALAQTSITVTPASTTVYTVDAVDINGCTGSDQVTVTVNSIPNVDAGPNQTLCAGQSITMIATGQGSLIWSGGLPNGTTITPGQDGWYFVTATTVFGCENTDSVFIAVEHPTIPEFLTDVSVGCVPLTVEFTNNTPGGSIDCIWQIDGTTFDNCGPFSYTFNSDGYYDITLTTTSPNGCEASVTVDDAIYVAPMPVADFLFSPVELTELNPHVNFHNTSINSSAWIWDFGDGSLSSLQDPMHDYPQAPGTYNVMLIAISPYNCIDTVMHTVVINEEVIYYVPNAFTPDGDNYNQDFKPIFTSGFDPYDYHLTIFNRWGEILFESYDAKYGWDGTYAGEICADGSYVWKVEFKVNATDERVMKTGHVSLMR
jgi:gliding motility-associated-like protein